MARAVKKAGAKPAKSSAPRRKKTTRKKASSALQRLEGAILTTLAEADELAVEMGLAGAVPSKSKKKKSPRR